MQFKSTPRHHVCCHVHTDRPRQRDKARNGTKIQTSGEILGGKNRAFKCVSSALSHGCRNGRREVRQGVRGWTNLEVGVARGVQGLHARGKLADDLDLRKTRAITRYSGVDMDSGNAVRRWCMESATSGIMKRSEAGMSCQVGAFGLGYLATALMGR